MKIKEIKYEMIHNLGNYENARLEVTVSISRWEDPEKVFEEVKEFVRSKLFGKPNIPVRQSLTKGNVKVRKKLKKVETFS